MHKNNPNLRSSREVLDYTKEMIEEYVKCQQDIIYFAEKYFQIITIDHGKQNIDLYDFQKKILKICVSSPEDKPHQIIRIPRQSGKCVYKDTKMKFRNKKTGEIVEMTAEQSFNFFKNTDIL
jgi:hypothetical protein